MNCTCIACLTNSSYCERRDTHLCAGGCGRTVIRPRGWCYQCMAFAIEAWWKRYDRPQSAGRPEVM